MGYKFPIEYKKGSTNRAADALSRRDEAPPAEVSGSAPLKVDEKLDEGRTGPLLVAAAHPIPRVIDLLRRETSSSPEMREITKVIGEGRAPPHLTMVDGLVYYHRGIFVSSPSSARTPILTEYHSSSLAGHPGSERTLWRVTMNFY